MNVRRVRVVVRGRVQGVAYRASTCLEARGFGVVGWVRNLADGSVELEAQGSAPAVERLISWCHQGPPAARVTKVVVEELSTMGGETGFELRY